MEGVNVVAILLGYLGVFVSAIASFVAFGLLIARKTKAARILFASGLLGGVLLISGATVWSVVPEVKEGHIEPVPILIIVSFLLASIGQFMAALQGPRVFAASLACAVGSVFVWLILVSGGYLGSVMAGSSLLIGFPLTVAGVLSAVASVLIPVLSFHRRPGA